MKVSDDITVCLKRGAAKGFVFSIEDTPQFFRLNNAQDKNSLSELFQSVTDCVVYDTIQEQLFELQRIRNPHIPSNKLDKKQFLSDLLKNTPLHEYGVWVYYPWDKKLVHLLNEEEYIELRTSRNLYKITREEQDLLRSKKIGVIGLSVGMTIAVCLAMERVCSEIRIADFDSLDLSNMNRLEAGVHEIGMPKWVIAQRRILELDPYIQLKIYTNGITEENIESFLCEGGQLDILVDECDSLDIKLLCRTKARELGIPVVMDTNDRGMLDIERFDLDNTLPIMHGLVGDLSFKDFKHLSNEDKVPVILSMIGSEHVSHKGKASMIEVGQSICTWPQLSSSVMLGAGVVTDVCRRILLNQQRESGRFYIDTEELVPSNQPRADTVSKANPFTPLTLYDMAELVAQLGVQPLSDYIPSKKTLLSLVDAAGKAPSTGNDQPWKWLCANNRLYLFHERSRSYSFGDFHNIASYISLGAAYENMKIVSEKMGLHLNTKLFPLGENTPLIASIDFKYVGDVASESYDTSILFESVYTRSTNRNPSNAEKIPDDEMDDIKKAAESITGAVFEWLTDRAEIEELGEVIGKCDRIRVLNTEGHNDLVNREMRWTAEEADAKKTGIDIRTLGMSPSQLSALSVIKDVNVIKHLKKVNGGNVFVKIAQQTVKTASAIGCITMPEYNGLNFFNGGRSMQRAWLMCEKLSWAVHPLISPFYLFPRITIANGEGLEEDDILELKKLRIKTEKLINQQKQAAEVFLFKIAKSDPPQLTTNRIPAKDNLFFL